MKVAFLDRDGVINEDPGYVYKIQDFTFCKGVVEALTLLQAHGYALIIVTNQSGIGRGFFSEESYHRLTQWYLQQLAQQGVAITDIFYCPHTPDDNCDCRKPKPGLLLKAINKYPVDMQSSLMIGDKLTDLQAAEAAGIDAGYLIQPSCYDNLLHVVKQGILK